MQHMRNNKAALHTSRMRLLAKILYDQPTYSQVHISYKIHTMKTGKTHSSKVVAEFNWRQSTISPSLLRNNAKYTF